MKSTKLYSNMQHFRWIIVALLIAITVVFFLYSISVWQFQSNQNTQQMILAAQKACNGRLSFYSKDSMNGHPIIVCGTAVK